MKGQREYLDYLQDILDATRKARRFVADMEYDEFAADDKALFAVVRALEVRSIPLSTASFSLLGFSRLWSAKRSALRHGLGGKALQDVANQSPGLSQSQERQAEYSLPRLGGGRLSVSEPLARHKRLLTDGGHATCRLGAKVPQGRT